MARKPETLPPGSYKTPKSKDAVKASEMDIFARDTYKPGDGDTRPYFREGSDHSKYKSLGFPC